MFCGNKLRDYSVVFILTKLIAVYLYKASMLFFWGVGRGQGNALQSAKNALKRLFSKNWPFLRLILTSFAVDVILKRFTPAIRN